jgi:cytochrome c2
MRATIFTILGLLGATALVTLLTSALDPNEASIDTARQMTTGGDPHHGVELIRFYGCASCHQIPGVRAPDAFVGPPLDHIAARNYVGGVARNTPRNMVSWIQNPKQMDARTAMPNLFIPEPDARDIASYLYTLR